MPMPRLMTPAELGIFARRHDQVTASKKAFHSRGTSKIHQVSWIVMKVKMSDAYVSGVTVSQVAGFS
jgi:hypothetical protein